MLDIKKLWEETLKEIELSLSAAAFNTWFKNTFISRYKDGVIYVCVPNAFVRDWLSNKYHLNILRILRQNCPQVRNIEYVVSKTPVKEPMIEKSSFIKNENISEQMEIDSLRAGHNDGLNPKYIFETFIVGSFNELAYAASQATIKNPGMVYNPLFVYGDTGLGKTHLIQAIGNHIKNHFKDKRVCYITSDQFITDFVDSVQNNKRYFFKEKYKKYDLFIMDDVQFIQGKEKSQEELFHLFNSLYENNKQIIFSSDKPPKYMNQLEERLRSRFEGGMIVDISKPEFESRVAILKEKSKLHGYSPRNEIIEYIASIIKDNIRELEGALNTVICQSQLKKRELSVNEVKTLLKDSVKIKKSVSFSDVIKTVSEFYNIEEKILFEKTRRKEVVKPRQVIMYILREDLNTSYPYIGQKLGGRDHTTVIHACEKIKKDLQKNSILSHEINQIKNILYGKHE